MFSLPSPSSDLKVLIKWSETVLNVRPQTVVETFDRANCNSIRDRCVVGGGGYRLFDRMCVSFGVAIICLCKLF